MSIAKWDPDGESILNDADGGALGAEKHTDAETFQHSETDVEEAEEFQADAVNSDMFDSVSAADSGASLDEATEGQE